MTTEYQKGVSLYLVVLIMSILLAIVLGLTSIIVGGARTAGTLGSSVKAFSAADTGIEQVLYKIYRQDDCSGISQTYIDESVNYGYSVTVTGDCASGATIIDSSGTYSDNIRKIEVAY